MSRIQKLPPKILDTKGGGKGVTARMMESSGRYYLYQRSDGPYEVFKARIAEAKELHGKFYPKREIYPSTECFGDSAWCFTSEKKARKMFRRLVSHAL